MKKVWHIIERIFGVYRWHPKIALRYLPIVVDIKKHVLNDMSVLEVGSGGLGITPYLKLQVVGLDVNFKPPYFPQLIPVAGSADQIPFSRNSFPFVVSVDMLEHIPVQNRPKVIHELLRVTKNKLYLGFPCGKEAKKQDKELNKLYNQKNQSNYQFLVEQVSFGLPDEQEIFDTIIKEAAVLDKKVAIEIVNNINIGLRKFLMSGWLSQNILVNIIFRKLQLLFIPIMKLQNQPPVYRKIFFTTIKYD